MTEGYSNEDESWVFEDDAPSEITIELLAELMAETSLILLLRDR